MRRFKDLDRAAQKKAVDHLFQRNYREIRWNGAGQPDNVKERLKEITTKIQFCGCGSCEVKLGEEMSKDPVIKEAILGKAMRQAEEAYYPEDTDIIVKV